MNCEAGLHRCSALRFFSRDPGRRSALNIKLTDGPTQRPKSPHMKATVFARLPLKGKTGGRRWRWRQRAADALSPNSQQSPPSAFKPELMQIPGVFHLGCFQDACDSPLHWNLVGVQESQLRSAFHYLHFPAASRQSIPVGKREGTTHNRFARLSV